MDRLKHVPFIGKHRPRPRLCAVCYENATHIEVEDRKLVTIDKDAHVRYQLVPHGTYYCAQHPSMPPISSGLPLGLPAR